MSRTNLGLGLIVVVALIAGTLFALTSQAQTSEDELFVFNGNALAFVQGLLGNSEDMVLGAAAGPEHTERQYFLAGSANGGRFATTSTAATYTLSYGDLRGATYVDWTPNVNTTVSISATSTHNYIPHVGDVAKIYLRNASSTAAATITLAAVDAGVDLQDNEDSADLAIAGLDWAELTLIRESQNLVTVLFQEYTEAD